MYIEQKPAGVVLPLADVVRAAYDKASDAEWNGSPCDHLWSHYRTVKAKLDAGELFYPTF